MRIYTEVIFKWDDNQNKLVEESSKSFEYSGALALCGDWGSWQPAGGAGQGGYDTHGNEWRYKLWRSAAGNYTDWILQRRPWHGAWEEESRHGGTSDDSYGYRSGIENRLRKHIALENNLDEDAYSSGDRTFIKDEIAAGKAWASNMAKDGISAEKIWEDTGFYSETYDPTSLDTVDMHDFGEVHADSWENVVAGAPGAGADPGEGLGEEYGVGTEGREAATFAIKGYVEDWKAIIDPDIYDEFQSDIDLLGTNLGFTKEDVDRAFAELPGEAAKIGADYLRDKERMIGEEGKYTTGMEQALEAKQKELEGTVTTREEAFEALRGVSIGDIRAAEAKEGAAGFAASGVGGTARDLLAKEIGEESRDIDVALTEGRELVTEGYDIKTEGLETAKTTALEDYLETRTRKGEDVTDPWETASIAYEQLASQYEGLVAKEVTDAASELYSLQADIFETITSTRTQMRAAGESGADLWTPFQEGEVLEGRASEFGWSEAIGFDPEFTTGLFGAYSEDADPYTLMGKEYTGAYTPFDIESANLYEPGKYLLPWKGGGGAYSPLPEEFTGGYGTDIDIEEEEDRPAAM